MLDAQRPVVAAEAVARAEVIAELEPGAELHRAADTGFREHMDADAAVEVGPALVSVTQGRREAALREGSRIALPAADRGLPVEIPKRGGEPGRLLFPLPAETP